MMDCRSCIAVQSTVFVVFWFLVDRFGPLVYPKLKHHHIAHSFLFELFVFVIYPLSGGEFTKKLLVRLAIAYFVYDLGLYALVLKPAIDFMLHDVITACVIFWSASSGQGLDAVLLSLFVAEWSSAANNMRRTLKKMGYERSNILEWIFIITFFYGRFWWGTKAVIKLLTDDITIPLVVQACIVVGWFLSLYWSLLIVQKTLLILKAKKT